MRPPHGLEPWWRTTLVLYTRDRLVPSLLPTHREVFCMASVDLGRVSTILESLASCDRDIVLSVAEGLTYWQQVRADVLFDAWAPKGTKVLYDQLDRLSVDDDTTLGTIAGSVLYDNAGVFYGAGFHFGQLVASVALETRDAIATAFAAKEDTVHDWAAVTHEVATRDLWEAAALDAADIQSQDLLKGEWSERLAQLEPNDAVHEADALLDATIYSLREFMFHEGRLDGEDLAERKK